MEMLEAKLAEVLGAVKYRSSRKIVVLCTADTLQTKYCPESVSTQRCDANYDLFLALGKYVATAKKV